MSLHLIIGDKLLSSWSLRGALALDLTGASYTEELIKLNQPDTRERLLKHSPTGKVPLLKTEHGTIADSLAIAEYLAEQFPDANLWPKDTAARAQARSACAQMHSGFFAMRGNMPFDLSHDAALSPVPADVQADIERMSALWAECRAAATEGGPYLFGRITLADAFFAPIAVRLRTYRVKLSAADEAYVETLYQWPAFKAWQKAGLGGVAKVKRVHVAAAVIRDGSGQILIARRADSQHQGGLWEFPGGKVEADESVETALARELHEELGIVVGATRPLIKVRHDYPDKQVLLDVWEVSAFTGEPHGAEGQPLAWVSPRDLSDYEFPAANQPIVAAAKLPAQYLITPEDLETPALLRGIQKAIAGGIKLIQLRAPNGYDPKYRDLAVDAVGLCAGKAQLMIKGPFEWLGDFPSAGWHITSAQLRKYAAAGRPLPASRWLAASCHNAEELALAEQMGVDFVTLSPVQPTQTHPGAEPLGWEQASSLIEGFSKPVFLLGGVGPAEVEKAWAAGAQGVAGIRAFWPEA